MVYGKHNIYLPAYHLISSRRDGTMLNLNVLITKEAAQDYDGINNIFTFFGSNYSIPLFAKNEQPATKKFLSKT